MRHFAPRARPLRVLPGLYQPQSKVVALLGARPLSVAEMIAAFDGARRELVLRHLETLALMGEVVVDADGRYGVSRKAA